MEGPACCGGPAWDLGRDEVINRRVPDTLRKNRLFGAEIPLDREPHLLTMSRQKLSELLLRVDQRPTGAAYSLAAGKLSSLELPLRPLKVALLSSFTIDPLLPYLKVEGARRGFALEVYIAPYNSVRRELLDPESGCRAFAPDVVFVGQLLEDLAPALTERYLEVDRDEHERASRRLLEDLLGPLQTFRAANSATVAVHNFPQPPFPLLGLHEADARNSQREKILALNQDLGVELAALTGAHLLDFDRLCADVGYRRWRNENSWSLGRAPLGSEALRELARLYGVFLQASHGAPKKCLVLDLDNTLWGGVLGEEGVGGVAHGQEAPGNLFRRFQQAILQLHRQGVILAVNSKNNLEDVEEMFASHPEMILQRKHISALRANWQPKPLNMEEIAQKLSLGLDSFVFFDDNPAERELMRQALPEVETLEVPPTPADYVRCLLDSRWFDKLAVTEEDRQRGSLYQAQARRQELRGASLDLESYLESLETVVEISPCDETTLPRVHALLHKTNQFNLTTRRHSREALQGLMADPASLVLALSARDRFGENGLVGVAIQVTEAPSATLDSLLLSCRVIGRGIETAFLSQIVTYCRERSCITLRGEFRPTAKNQPAASFYSNHGFQPAGDVEDGARGWQLDLQAQEMSFPGYIQLQESRDE